MERHGIASESMNQELAEGGCRVGFIVSQIPTTSILPSPMAYSCPVCPVPAVAMVTASHTDNGCSGVKMGCDRPVTFGLEEMSRLKDIVLFAGTISKVVAPLFFIPPLLTAISPI
jgi:phosphomannomutase/phosphoglucomutase